MLNRWKKTDVFIAIIFVLTVLSYFLFPSWAFKLLLWTTIITAIIRFMVVAKRRLLWKIRNRLIFSGLFLIATPILFISIFLYFIGSVVIAQYGSIIINNMMNQHVEKLEPIPSRYLRYDKSRYMYMDIQRLVDSKLFYFTSVLWEKRGESFEPFFKYPNDFNEKKIQLMEFNNYFLVDDKLYIGVLKKNETHAVMVAYEINQEFLDIVSSISEFRVIYKSPGPYFSRNKNDVMATVGMTVSSSDIIDESPIEDEMDVQDSPTLALFTYSFYDFNTIINSKPLKRNGDFVLSMDYGKIYDKIISAISSPAHMKTKQVLLALIIPFFTLLITSFLIGFRMVRVITRSINQLTKGTQRIRNGDFSFRIKTRSGDQLQYLAESFNEMASGIDRLLVDEKEKHRLEEELRIARSIQLKLLPADSFQSDYLEIAAVNIPAAEIAGDYFDYFYEEGVSLSMLVADVSGKGASAAFYMAELKGVINHLQREAMSPASLISECHHSLKQSFDRITFITMSIVQLNIPKQKFIISRAGHTPALFYNAQAETCTEIFPDGMAIGLINFSGDKIKEIEMDYHSGDIIFLFSDGLSEIMNDEDEMLGVDHLKRILKENHHLPTDEIKQKMLDFSIKFSDSGINRDDLTFIILKIK
jgi:serine phosphatase RsbU (regulator of sigma subunit)